MFGFFCVWLLLRLASFAFCFFCVSLLSRFATVAFCFFCVLLLLCFASFVFCNFCVSQLLRFASFAFPFFAFPFFCVSLFCVSLLSRFPSFAFYYCEFCCLHSPSFAFRFSKLFAAVASLVRATSSCVLPLSCRSFFYRFFSLLVFWIGSSTRSF